MIERENYFLQQVLEKPITQQKEITFTQQQSLNNLLKAYNDIFTQELSKLGCTQGVQHVINTDETIPIKQRPYRATIPDQEFIAEEIQKMLQAGII